MKSRLFLILTLSAALLLPIGASAEDAKPGRAGRGDPADRLKMMTEKLSLTEEQQTKVKEIYAKNAPQMKELMSKGRDNLSEDDKKKVREMMRTQMEEIGAVLTPEQKEKMKGLRTERGGAGARRGKGAAK